MSLPTLLSHPRWKDIRLWILLFFLIRLVGITNPPLETGHNWRQTTVTMVARNFLEVDNNILYPRIDMAGEKSGITGMEFPLLNYLIYLLSEIFGYEHWHGRLINLVVTSIGAWYFFRSVRLFFNRETAFYAALILSCSIWFSFGRKIMPDTFSMSIVIVGLYYGLSYLTAGNRIRELALYAVLVSIGVLCKLPSGYILVLFAPILLSKNITPKSKERFIIGSAIAAIAPLIWYFYWSPHLTDTYGFWHFFSGKGMADGAKEIMADVPATLKRFYDTPLKFIGFAAFLFGIFQSLRTKNMKILYTLMFGFLAFFVIVLKAGWTFHHHSYYIIPFVPIMALVAAYGLVSTPWKQAIPIIMMAIATEGLLNQTQDFRIRPENRMLLSLEEDLNKISDQNDLIIMNSDTYPTPIYFAHRKGWLCSNQELLDEGLIEERKDKGASFIVVLKRGFGGDVELNRSKLFDQALYTIYSIE